MVSEVKGRMSYTRQIKKQKIQADSHKPVSRKPKQKLQLNRA